MECLEIWYIFPPFKQITLASRMHQLFLAVWQVDATLLARVCLAVTSTCNEYYWSIAPQMEHSFSFLKFYMKVSSS